MTSGSLNRNSTASKSWQSSFHHSGAFDAGCLHYKARPSLSTPTKVGFFFPTLDPVVLQSQPAQAIVR